MAVSHEQIRSKIVDTLGQVDAVLDVGCGNCDLVRFLVQQMAREVVGIDINIEPVVEEVRYQRNGELRTVWCDRIDAQRMETFSDERFDAVVSIHALHEITDPNAALHEMKRVLKEGGTVLIADFTIGETRWDEDYFTTSEVWQMLAEVEFNDVQVEKVAGEHFMFASATK